MPKYKIVISVTEIEKKNYHLFLDLTIGDIPCRLLLDTGASKTVFDRKRVLRFVDAEEIQAHEARSVGLGTTDMETQAVKLKRLQIGKLNIKSFKVAILDISHVNDTYEACSLPEIDGVLGSDFLMKYKAVLDYGKGMLTFKVR